MYDDSFIVNEYWHERNFSDRDEKNLPDIIQKAPGVENPEQPEPTQTPVPSKKPAEEENGPESRDGENDMNGDQYTGDGLYTEKNAGDDLYSGSGTYTGSTYGTGGLSVGGNTVKDRENTNAKAARCFRYRGINRYREKHRYDHSNQRTKTAFYDPGEWLCEI